ncbi:histidine phosphatase family protein [Kibdelosporangium aridum]|uniref:Histidine phosphatase family protein n=1 Tax=Kibdelosporangium aridum TaxID=2030 RepID=A0A428Z392_KIBAR|nr:histidine phosphatase family protein [Kibdelosporangium aridum]RSM80388.1 histidine phosphatase family protein [Kibdelosporangium aridum]
MPLVYLIRHGQASFGADDYDVLSPVGHQQGKHVGAELRRRGVRAGQVWSGTLKRQRDTALAAELDADLQQDPRWNEFDHMGLVREIQGDSVTPHGFQQSLDAALRNWGGLVDFTEAVGSALDDLLKALPSGQTGVVFTSGGVIAAVCAKLWGLDAAGFVAVNRVSVNCGITKLVHGRSGTSLVTYNDHAHFEGEHRDLLTYR